MPLIQDLKSIIAYAESEGVEINFEEFLFQAQNHPDYPSLLAITDTLSFFNIDNGVIPVGISEIELLPDRFVALLDTKKSQPCLHFVEKKGDDYFCFKDKIPMVLSMQDLVSRWKHTVLLVEKSEINNDLQIRKNKWFWVLPLLCILLFLGILVQFQSSLQDKTFFILPILGVLFSVAALKDLFGAKSELLNNFCNITASTSCTTVVGSKKWKVFEIVNFSDLSIVFFSSQFLGLLLFLFMADATAYFSIQKIMLVCAVPVLLTSVYYQKFVEKKWCPICLVIICIILLELVCILFLLQISTEFLIQPIIIFGFVLVSVTLVWFMLKKLLTQQKELKEFQIKNNRFIRNYEIFKNTLVASSPIEDNPVQSGVILLGNVDAPLKIIVVTSPFCGFCMEAHTIIEEIIDKYPEKICFDIRFNFNVVNGNQKSKKIHQQLISIYFNQGQEAFMKVLHNWFENKDENKWDIIENSVINEAKLNQILEEQFIWNQHNNINYTPAIIINQYIFPKQYDRKDLIHFINELSDDEDF